MPTPAASRRAEHVLPTVDHASCDPPLKADRPRLRIGGGAFAGATAKQRGRPPIPLNECCRCHREPRCAASGAGGRRSLGALLRYTREQCTNLGLPVAPVSPQRADRRQLPGLRPPRDGLGVDAKHRGDLRRRQQRLGFGCACGHVRGLSSWTSAAILRFVCLPGAPRGAWWGCPLWSTGTILPSPAVTRRPPGAKFLDRDAQVRRRSLSLTVSLAILIVASRCIREYFPASTAGQARPRRQYA